MSTIGPKGPADPALAKVLQLRRPTTTEVQAPTLTQAPTEQTQTPIQTPKEDAFDVATGQSSQVATPVEGAALSQLIARLRAKGEASPTTSVSGPTIVQTDEGKVLSGSVQIEGKAGLKKLDGVVRVGGSLAVEGTLKNPDLLSLRDLKTVEGRLSFEGMRSKPPSE